MRPTATSGWQRASSCGSSSSRPCTIIIIIVILIVICCPYYLSFSRYYAITNISDITTSIIILSIINY